MKDEAGQDGEHEAFSHQDLYEEYKSSYLQPGAEVRPCRDPGLLERAARFLRGSPDLTEAFTAFPFYRAVAERCADGTDSRRHLTGFIKATEMLESLCINMFLQPWKKEIRSVKTFTGAFVYCLLPVFSSSTIESVLASIGYLPNSDASRSEFILSADVDADRALLLGFELLLARVECHHLLDLLGEHQLGPQEWLEVLQRRKQPAKVVDPTEKQTIAEEWKGNNEKKKEELERKEEALHSETIPQPKQRRCHLNSVDHSVIELQMTYPDLAFRGRPLLPDQPHKAQPTMTSTAADGSSALSETNVTREATAASPRAFGGDDGCNDRIGVGVTGPSDTSKLSFRDSDESRVDDDPLSGPPAISLVITPRAGPREASMKRGRAHPIAASSDETQQKSSRENVMADKPESPSLSSTEEQQLRALAERMGQLSVQEDEEKTKGRGDGTVREGDVCEKQNQGTKL
uniref:Uncharacterized LOC105916049 n=1 Tax=Fundulus heteroclitus TaxID=8078 RepID=A0A3Q2QJQ6_FUNHE